VQAGQRRQRPRGHRQRARQLVPKIKALCPPALGPAPAAARRAPVVPLPAQGLARTGRTDVLAIGSSTGGPDALTAVLPQLPASFPVPVVVVQHMPPVFTRMFAQRLDSTCALSVKEAEHGDLVVPGRVLIAPGDKHLELKRVGTSVVAQLTSAPPEHFCRPAVDVLFRSVAQVHGGNALAVVLTGMGSDGARGAEVLRRAGAEVVAQDEASSVVWGMPARWSAPASRTASCPRPHRRRRGRRRRPVPSVGARGGAAMSLAASDFDYIRDVVRRHSAIVLDPGKEYLVESRLVPLARKEGEQSIASLVARMRTERTGTLTGRVVDAMTTNETSFFRDDHPFDAMQKHVLPELVLARAAERRLAVWCGASSSGQEPYSLTMLLKDVLTAHPGWSASLLATDLSTEMLERTRAGLYSQLEVNRGLPVAMLVRHFDKVGTQWQVKQDLRAMVRTRPLNLAVPIPADRDRSTCLPAQRPHLLRRRPPRRPCCSGCGQVLRPDGLPVPGWGGDPASASTNAFDRVVLDRRPCLPAARADPHDRQEQR
jgi:chemotaxis methyl-accepting protein methylase